MGAAHGIEGSFVIVHEFMAKGLGLKGNDLIVYARIFGFANAGKPYFESKAGSAGFCGISKRAAFSVVSRRIQRISMRKHSSPSRYGFCSTLEMEGVQ